MEDDELLFLTVANLRPEKGYDVLLEAAKAIADQDLPIRIAAVGRGPLRDVLRTRHGELGLKDRFAVPRAARRRAATAWRAPTPSSWPHVMRGFPLR